MILCIESHLGDRYLTGKARTRAELKRQLQTVESLYDRQSDNFTELLCRMYGFEETAEEVPDHTWDRDTGLLFPLTHPQGRPLVARSFGPAPK